MSVAHPPDAAAAASRSLARPLVFWRFSRPHTILGTTVSVLALYALGPRTTGVLDVAAVLIAAWCVNVFIVGLNQLEDVEIDRINKPWLPLAAGELSPRAARAIVAACAVVPVGMALTQGPIELVAVLCALAVGTAYSSWPLRLKRFPFAACLSITLVRAVVVNLGVYAHFAGSLDDVPPAVWALTLFVIPFSFAIAILKDVPDVEGDRRFRIRTFSVRLGPRRVLSVGMAALTLAYLGMALAGPLAIPEANGAVLAVTHLAALALLWAVAARVDVADGPSFTRFYMQVWQLFFVEYALVPLAVLA